jgi:hypothetical protein
MRLLGLSEKTSPTVEFLPFALDAPQAGTSHFQLASLLEQIQRATLDARKLLIGRSVSDLTTRLEPESWSAAECADHLARTARAFLPAISKAMAAAPRLTTHRALRTGTVASLLIRHLEPPYRLRYKVLSQLAPQEKDFAAAWSAFEESQTRLSEVVRSAAGLAIDEVKVQCPVNARVTYNVYGAFRMLTAHERRHLWQMGQILTALDRRRQIQTAV